MEKIVCPICGGDVTDKMKFCKNCGCLLEESWELDSESHSDNSVSVTGNIETTFVNVDKSVTIESNMMDLDEDAVLINELLSEQKEKKEKKEKTQKITKLMFVLVMVCMILVFARYIISESILVSQKKLTKENIDHVTALLEYDIGEQDTVYLSPEDYEFASNNVKMFGMNGHIELGWTAKAKELHKVNIAYWISDEQSKDFNIIVEELIELYGSDYSESDNFYNWNDVLDFSNVYLWEDSENKTVKIEWILDIDE